MKIKIALCQINVVDNKEKNIENARHILSLLNHVVDDGYFSAEDEKIIAMMENLCGFIGNESEREN